MSAQSLALALGRWPGGIVDYGRYIGLAKQSSQSKKHRSRRQADNEGLCLANEVHHSTEGLCLTSEIEDERHPYRPLHPATIDSVMQQVQNDMYADSHEKEVVSAAPTPSMDTWPQETAKHPRCPHHSPDMHGKEKILRYRNGRPKNVRFQEEYPHLAEQYHELEDSQRSPTAPRSRSCNDPPKYSPPQHVIYYEDFPRQSEQYYELDDFKYSYSPGEEDEKALLRSLATLNLSDELQASRTMSTGSSQRGRNGLRTLFGEKHYHPKDFFEFDDFKYPDSSSSAYDEATPLRHQKTSKTRRDPGADQRRTKSPIKQASTSNKTSTKENSPRKTIENFNEKRDKGHHKSSRPRVSSKDYEPRKLNSTHKNMPNGFWGQYNEPNESDTWTRTSSSRTSSSTRSRESETWSRASTRSVKSKHTESHSFFKADIISVNGKFFCSRKPMSLFRH
ncbi:uncharacterized protein BCR38DRAFT_407618 [Pseudomassariella vexata]|uniref:Uncharacterized protein n=1 Tax=Pseudomassariella vexata TaxID=1141098 RepID=A0A1Y2E9X7_9PEZI|nr:uncharacterized protein BCR38DRAFT_407618 [Pseudomassariella vexata]ORY67665.1 hypothetical protein BCR38DRAFT_407618 [Pseudomassariella vexata]